ncbi:archease [bacterium]|nr:MAG: archease [bacterium]
MRKWIQLEHTADLSVMGEGDTREEALLALMEGFTAQIIDPGTIKKLEERVVEAEGVDVEDAVVTLLGELIYLIYVKNWLPASFESVELTKEGAKAVVRGEKYDPSRHRFLTEIKAATYHDYDFSKGADNLWRVRAVFDR